MSNRTCMQCEKPLPEGVSERTKFCSAVCRSWSAWLGPGGSKHCTECGSPMLVSKTSKRGPSRCAKCSKHGLGGYDHRKCRCDICREAKNAAQRKFSRRRFEESGEWPRGRWIKTAERLAIYERDGWTCQICGHPVNRTAWANGPRDATLDHIIPRSKGGSHEPENLRTACHLCNARRGDREALDLSRFEVAA